MWCQALAFRCPMLSFLVISRARLFPRTWLNIDSTCIHGLYTCQSGLERWRHRFVADGFASEHIAKEPLACCSLASDASATFQALQDGIKNKYQAQSISGLLQPIGEWWPLGEEISHVTFLFAHFTSGIGSSRVYAIDFAKALLWPSGNTGCIRDWDEGQVIYIHMHPVFASGCS